MECSECGKKIGSRDVHYSGIRDNVPYRIHPACYSKWVKRQAEGKKTTG